MLLFDLGVKCCAVGTRCQGACFCSGACLHSDPTVIFRRCWCLGIDLGDELLAENTDLAVTRDKTDQEIA